MSTKKVLIITAAVLAAFIGAIALYLHQQQPAAGRLVTVQQGTIAATITETGEICARQVSTIYADSSQKVTQVQVALGDTVHSGDVLLTYSNTQDLQLSQLHAQLIAAKKGYDIASENSRLEAASLQISLQTAQKNLSHLQELAQAGAISQQEVTSATDQLAQLQNQQQALQNAVQTAQNQYQSQKAQLDAAIAVIAHDNERSVITAPFDGIITALTVTPGAMTHAGNLVIEIQSNHSRYLKSDLLVEDAAKLQIGTPATATSESLAVTYDQLTVSKIYPKAIDDISALGVQQKRLPVELTLPTPTDTLPLGAELEITFTIQTKTDALLLPKTAVYKKEGQQYVLRPDGKTAQPVTTGLKQGDNVEILTGLTAGESVLNQS